MTQVILGKSRVREICMPGSVRAKAEWLSYSTISELGVLMDRRCKRRDAHRSRTARFGLEPAHPPDRKDAA
jgi:hypothetical protein